MTEIFCYLVPLIIVCSCVYQAASSHDIVYAVLAIPFTMMFLTYELIRAIRTKK